MPPEKSPQSPVLCGQKVIISNKLGEKLVGLLHEACSKELVILCHGLRATKNDSILLDLAAALAREGVNVCRFDFSGNGESEGVFQYGNYRKEADDLRSVVSYFSAQNYDIIALVGHSKGGNAVLLYASMYHDVTVIVNISGRFALEQGIDGRLGKNYMERIKKDGYIDVRNRKGQIEYRVTEESLRDRLSTDTLLSSRSISKDCRVLTVHGSKDETVPVRDALMFAANIPNHELHILAGANHRTYSARFCQSGCSRKGYDDSILSSEWGSVWLIHPRLRFDGTTLCSGRTAMGRNITLRSLFRTSMLSCRDNGMFVGDFDRGRV